MIEGLGGENSGTRHLLVEKKIMEISFKQHLAIYNKKVARVVNKLNMAYIAILLKKQTSLIHKKFLNF